MARLGVARINDLVGRVDFLNTRKALDHWKAKGLDFSNILEPAKIVYEGTQVYQTKKQNHSLNEALDKKLIKLAEGAIKRGEKVKIRNEILNVNRVVGTMLSHEVTKATKGRGLPHDTIEVKLNGSAGQSLGAWLCPGITLEVEGDSNDYVGKGLCGGKIIIYPPKNSTFSAESNVLIGNVVLYGATSGEAYFRGIAAERFCVRNSGANAVVEGIGDHGCEYMTGGRVVVLGPTGRNFGAGMSGGIAYVWNREGDFEKQCNTGTFELEEITSETDEIELKSMIEKHLKYTGSAVAEKILKEWSTEIGYFVKVMPSDYKRVLEELSAREKMRA